MPEKPIPIDWLKAATVALVALLLVCVGRLVFSEIHRRLDYQTKLASTLQCAASDGIPLIAHMGTYGGAEEVLVCLRRTAIIEENP